MKSLISKPVPRYLAVADILVREIGKGRFAVGDMLPPESELCARFGISRHTVREAVRQLTERGMVTRRAGVGTTVKSRSASSRYTASISDPGELFAYAQQTAVKVLLEDCVTITGDWLAILPDAGGQVWPRFVSLRYADSGPLPIAYTETLVQPAYEAIRDRIHRPGHTVYQLIEDLRGEPVQTLRQEISCIALPTRIAALLKARKGAPALRVLRYYLAADETLLSLAINTYPQDRFKLTTRWQLNWTGSAERDRSDKTQEIP